MPLGEEPRGVVTLLLLAREKPLNDEENAELARKLAPQKRIPAGETMLAVWLENGERVTGEPDRIPILAKGRDVGDAEEQTRALMRQIHPRFGYVRGVCFGNQGKGNP